MDKPKNRILTMAIGAAVIILLAILIFVAMGSKSNKPIKTVDATPKPTNSMSVQTVAKAPIYEIDLDKLKSAIESISKLKEDMSIQTSTYRSLQLVEGSEGDYRYLNTSNVVCKTKSESSLSPEAEFNCYVEFRGKSLYPSSINFGYNYKTEAEDALMSSWVYAIISDILNDNISNSMQALPNGSTKESVYKVDNLEISISKSNSPLENGVSMASYAVMVSEKTDETLKDISIVKLDDFNPSDNPSYGLFNTSIFSYSETLSLLEDRIGRVYGLNDKADTSIISDRVINNLEGKSIDTSNYWVVADEKGNQVEISISSNEEYILADNASKIDITYNLSTLPNKDKKEAFYSMEDILEGILSTKVELQEYYDDSEFTLTLDKPDNAEAIGYPLKLSFKSEEIKTGGDTNYKLSVIATTYTKETQEVT